MYFGKDTDGAITLNFSSATSKTSMVIGKDSSGYIVLDFGEDSTPGQIYNYGRDIAAQRIITCTNSEGEAAIFTEKAMDPFILCSADGIYTIQNTVNISENTMTDGGTYLGSVMKTRNITLTVKDIVGHDANRELIDVVFDKGKPGVLEVQDGSHVRSIEYYVESVTSTATPVTRITTISLLCPDPYFYDPNETQAYIANLVPKFEFIHEFSEYGEEIGLFSDQRIGTIVNKSAYDGVGLTMIVEALGHVRNPVITLVETQEHIALGTSSHPFVMEYGDRIVITTKTRKKNVFDEDGNSINQYLTEDSTFFQILRGTNSIGYDAAEGADYITITIGYRYQYMRA